MSVELTAVLLYTGFVLYLWVGVVFAVLLTSHVSVTRALAGHRRAGDLVLVIVCLFWPVAGSLLGLAILCNRIWRLVE